MMSNNNSFRESFLKLSRRAVAYFSFRMKLIQIVKYTVLLFLCFLFSEGLYAQDDIVKFESPVEDAHSSAPNGKAVVTIVSPNADLLVKGSLYGNLMQNKVEYVKGERQKKNGEYYYIFTFTPHPDLDTDGVHSETFTISNDYGSKDCKLTLVMGKSYTGRFEIPVELVCMDEGSSVLAAANAARLRIISDILDELTVRFNGVELLKNGQPSTTLPGYVTTVDMKDDMVNINFDISNPEASKDQFKNPSLVVSTSNGENINFRLPEGYQLENKRSFQFRILRQVTKTVFEQKDLSFEEIIAKAKSLEEKYDFEAAANMYHQAMNHVDCSLDKKETIRDKETEMRKMRRLDFTADWAERNAERLGIQHDSAYYYYNGARGIYQTLAKKYPENETYKEKAEYLEKFVTDNFKDEVQKKVLKNNQVITGKLTMAKGKFGSAAHVQIYRLPTSKIPKLKDLREDYECIGKTDEKGEFRIIVPHDDPIRYIYFYRDKKAVPVNEHTTTLNVVWGEK